MLASYDLKSTDKRVVPKMQIAAKQEYRWRLEQKGAFRLIGKRSAKRTAPFPCWLPRTQEFPRDCLAYFSVMKKQLTRWSILSW